MKPEITVICYWASVNGKNGYASTFNFYEFLSNMYKVNVIVPCINNNIFCEVPEIINPDLKIYRISSFKNINLTDNVFEKVKKISEDNEFIKRIEFIQRNSEVIICDSVFYVSFAKKFFDKKIIYRCLDVELDKLAYVRDVIGLKIEDGIYEQWFEFEQEACSSADIVFGLTEADKKRLIDLYNLREDKFYVLPYCYADKNTFTKYLPRKREKVGKLKCLMVSSNNVEQVEVFKQVINTLNDVEFHFVGGMCDCFDICQENIFLYGKVSDDDLQKLLWECDFAININSMTYGMNIKNMDYFIAGIPVIANELGVRGYGAEKNVHYFYSTIESLEKNIREFCLLSADERYEIAKNAFDLVTTKFTYNQWFEKIKCFLPEKTQESFYIFGAGQIGEKALKNIIDDGYKCLGFVDNNPQIIGAEKLGKKIFSPEKVFEELNKDKLLKIVIAVNQDFFPSVVKQVLKAVSREQVWVYEPFSLYLFENERLELGGFI